MSCDLSSKVKGFVFDPEGDDVYAEAARAAIRAYADYIREHNLTLAADLDQWMENIHDRWRGDD